MAHDPTPPEKKPPVSESDATQPQSKEEAKVWEVLEEARQQVKHLVKRELEAEVITSEILNIRLKTGR